MSVIVQIQLAHLRMLSDRMSKGRQVISSIDVRNAQLIPILVL